MSEQQPATLREQVARAIEADPGLRIEDSLTVADAVLAVFAERERVLRSRIEALCREWGLGTDPESGDYGDPQVQQFGAEVLGVFDD